MLFFPGLLTSCADHRIVGPGDPAVPPVGDEDYDGNDIAKTCVVTALGMIPEVGEILAALVEIFWPETKEDPWDEVKDRVEALIKKDIDELVYQQVKQDLGGFKNGQPGGLVGLMTLYLDEVKAYNETLKTNPNASPEGVIRQWVSTRAAFVNALPHFQADNYEDLLLPLFVPFASMHLALLRDIVIDGKAWGRSEAEHQQDILDLQSAITAYASYTYDTLRFGYDNAIGQALNNGKDLCDAEAAGVLYASTMTLLAQDYAATWPYFDVTLYPNGPRIPLSREIYSGLQGYCKGFDLVQKYGFNPTNSFLIGYSVPPKKAPTQITIWGGEVIEGMQVTYPTGGGLNGITQTVRMGLDSLTGGSNQPPKGGTFHISPTNPIVLVRLSFNKYPPQYDNNILGVSAIQFVYKDGATSPWTGTLNNSYIVEVKPPSGHYVSSIYFGAYLVVFGFQYMNLQLPAGTDAMRTIYITSPTERTADDFTQAFPELGDSSTLITEELKADREAHWASFKARAAALK
ncbi:Pesticidal crystal protein cry1Da AltName: Full=Insecticidal delta-endotoxin CryID(a) [Fibrisoma limi BUZ 3]|uniref:WGS project CAIT00000000 data, contig 4 n=2 Tax=Fibrisoma limi TaxID=663275 RepID=I2GDA3_9BACT|nr:Pesticidal crystal protein cry1Da AltName: Full=Insecticidal delta-endotoxin CryID(a) [Fibrisoma limi BUZ 3]